MPESFKRALLPFYDTLESQEKKKIKKQILMRLITAATQRQRTSVKSTLASRYWPTRDCGASLVRHRARSRLGGSLRSSETKAPRRRKRRRKEEDGEEGAGEGEGGIVAKGSS